MKKFRTNFEEIIFCMKILNETEEKTYKFSKKEKYTINKIASLVQGMPLSKAELILSVIKGKISENSFVKFIS